MGRAQEQAAGTDVARHAAAHHLLPPVPARVFGERGRRVRAILHGVGAVYPAEEGASSVGEWIDQPRHVDGAAEACAHEEQI